MRILTFTAAMTALLTIVPAAHAQERQCPKVDIYFSCLDGTEAKGPYKCKARESETDCCARWKKRARNKWCKKAGGLTVWECACPENDGDTIGRLPGLPGRLRPSSRPRGTLTPVDPPRRTLKPVDPPKRTLTPVDPPKRQLTPVDPPKRTLTIAECRRIKYSFTCFNGASSSGKFACGGKETKARCCRRAQRIAHRGCRNKGRAVRFDCTCLPKKKQDRPGKLQLRRR